MIENPFPIISVNGNDKKQKEQEGKTETDLNKENRKEVNSMLEEMGVEEDLISSDSALYNERLQAVYKKYLLFYL